MAYSCECEFLDVNNILPFVKQELRLQGETGDDPYIIDCIKQGIGRFVNLQTQLPRTCLFEICNREALLPVSVNKVDKVWLLDHDNQTKIFSLELPHRFLADQDIATSSDRWYDMYGNKIVFYNSNLDGRYLQITFTDFITGPHGEKVLPSDDVYLEGIIYYSAYRYYQAEQNLAMSREYNEKFKNRVGFARGVANSSSWQEMQTIQAMNGGIDRKFKRGYIWGG